MACTSQPTSSKGWMNNSSPDNHVYDSFVHSGSKCNQCRWVQGNAYLPIVSQKASLRWECRSQSLGTGRKHCVRKREGLFMKCFKWCFFLLPVTATLVWSHFLPSGTMAPFFLFWILIIIIFTVALGAFCAFQTPLAELPMKLWENYKEEPCTDLKHKQNVFANYYKSPTCSICLAIDHCNMQNSIETRSRSFVNMQKSTW